MNYNIMGKKLEMIRGYMALTQTEFANLLGLRQQHYALIETGKKRARLKTIKKIADALQMPIDYFFGDDTKYFDCLTVESYLHKIKECDLRVLYTLIGDYLFREYDDNEKSGIK